MNAHHKLGAGPDGASRKCFRYAFLPVHWQRNAVRICPTVRRGTKGHGVFFRSKLLLDRSIEISALLVEIFLAGIPSVWNGHSPNWCSCRRRIPTKARNASISRSPRTDTFLPVSLSTGLQGPVVTRNGGARDGPRIASVHTYSNAAKANVRSIASLQEEKERARVWSRDLKIGKEGRGSIRISSA